jgi:hypothetical protein
MSHSLPSGERGTLADRDLPATCHLAYAFEVGHAIDLEACDRRVERAARQQIRTSRRIPQHFEYRPPPLRISQGPSPLIANGIAADLVEIVLYDFGAALVRYEFRATRPLTGLADLAQSLQSNVELERDARNRAAALLVELGAAVTRPRLAEIVEDYVIVAVDPGATETVVSLDGIALAAAQILRGSGEDLAPEEIADALAERLSFSTTDLTIIDWNAALIIDREPGDTIDLLEFANVQLLELRHLDNQLDQALDRAYPTLAASERRLLRSLRPPTTALRTVGELQMDGASLFQRVSSAVKLVGDQFLGRAYQAIARRFHFESWDRAISRKLEVLDGIYQKMSDQVMARRLEVLEWIVIILIAVELVLSLVR